MHISQILSVLLTDFAKRLNQKKLLALTSFRYFFHYITFAFFPLLHAIWVWIPSNLSQLPWEEMLRSLEVTEVVTYRNHTRAMWSE